MPHIHIGLTICTGAKDTNSLIVGDASSAAKTLCFMYMNRQDAQNSCD